MKKEGIQTRNRKLSTKSKKKKNGQIHMSGLTIPDIIKPHHGMDAKFSTFGSPGLSHYMPSVSSHLSHYVPTVSSSFQVPPPSHHAPSSLSFNHHQSSLSFGSSNGFGSIVGALAWSHLETAILSSLFCKDDIAFGNTRRDWRVYLLLFPWMLELHSVIFSNVIV